MGKEVGGETTNEGEKEIQRKNQRVRIGVEGRRKGGKR